MGVASTTIHDHIQVGDTIIVHAPAGDFHIDAEDNIEDEDDDDDDSTYSRPIVLLSTGVGVTPILSMLHELLSFDSAHAQQRSRRRRPIIWIHGTQDEAHHAFHEELSQLVHRFSQNNQALHGASPSVLRMYTIYSRQQQPLVMDKCRNEDIEHIIYNRRIDAALVHTILSESVGLVHGADYYLCGTPAFAATIEEDLVSQYQVDSLRIHSESF
jgi:ferredoxin-NADP reductase